ncbi:MAG: hypothetical protein SGILL_000829 [Bacillariaceae sp.]
MPSQTVKSGWTRRTAGSLAGATSPVSRKRSAMSYTSASEATCTTKSLSSNTDFTLPSPPGAKMKPKFKGNGNDTKDSFRSAKPISGLSVIYDAEHSCSESGTSYGSLTLGGATSLSSNDTFQNSSRRPESSVSNGSILKQKEEGSTLPHSQKSPSSGYLPRSIQQHHSYDHINNQSIAEDGDWSSSSSSTEVDPASAKRSPKESKTNSRRSGTSPKKKAESLSSATSLRKKNKQSKAESPKRSPSKRQRNSPSNRPKKHKPRNAAAKSSPSRRTSAQIKNDEACENPSGALNHSLTNSGGHWGDAVIMDLSSWQSDDDDESSLGEEPMVTKSQAEHTVRRKQRVISNWKSPLMMFEEDEQQRMPSFLGPQRTSPDGKPRSAYDKNAEWYCSSEDEKGSVTSDCSSVLSAFRPKKRVTEAEVVPQSEASMDLDALLGGTEEGSSEAIQVDQSMTFDNLQASKGHGNIMSMIGMIPDLGEESAQSDAESIDVESVLASTRKKKKSSKQGVSVSESTRASETDTRSPPESAPSISSSSDSNESPIGEKKSLMKQLTSQKVFRWVSVGLALILILDIVLLAIFLARRGSSDTSNSTTLADVPENICLDWIPSGGKSQICSSSETALGGGVPNLAAQAIRSSSSAPVDVALIPGGLTHQDIPKGEFTEEVARAIFQPSDSLRRAKSRRLSSGETTLVSLRVTGTELQLLLEKTIAAALEQGKESLYPYAAGLRFSVDASSPGVYIESVEIGNDDGWRTIDENQEYDAITTQDWAKEYFQATGAVLELTPLSAMVSYALATGTLTIPVFSTSEYKEDSKIDDGKASDGTIRVLNSICLEWLPGQGMSNVCTKEETSSQGGGVGNVVAWSVLDFLNSATEFGNDVFLLNGGECQTDIAEGLFSEDDAKALLPADQEIVLLNVTGLQLMNALEQAIDFSLASAQNRGSYPYSGGLRFDVSPSASVGNRLSNVQYFSRGRWKAVSEGRQYRLATTLELADGMLGYDALYDALSRLDPLDLTVRESFLKHVKQKGRIEDLPPDKFSTQSYATKISL